jgi:GxxExxY protein
MNTSEIMKLYDNIRAIAFAIHFYHGNGYLEKVYENAFVNRLQKAGINVKQQQAMVIHDEDGTVIGEYFTDIVVNNMLIIELKACRCLTNEHTSQLLHYLKATGIEHGVLINFGSFRFEMRKYIKSKEA